MSQTITIDILNDKALNLLRDLERLDLIRLHGNSLSSESGTTAKMKYKGAMSKQAPESISTQLKALRDEWE